MLDRDETQKANFDTKRRKLQMDLKKKKNGMKMKEQN